MKTDSFRIYLRAFEAGDYLTTIKWRNDDEIWDMLGGTRYIVSKEYEKQWVQDAIFDRKQIKMGICFKENDELIGFCGIKDLDWINRKAESFYMLGEKEYWGKGLATEAMMLLLDFAFNERNFHRIYKTIVSHNYSSIRVSEKCGLIKEGVQRQALYRNGKYHDLVMMSVLKEDFNTLIAKKGF